MTQRLPKPWFGDFAQSRQAARRGDRVAAERAGLVDRAQGCELAHHLSCAAKSCQRHAPADDLAEDAHVGLEARDQLGVHALRAAQGYAKARHHLVEYQQSAVLGAQFPQPGHERHAGAHEVHVAGNGFQHHAGDLRPVGGEGLLDLREVVVLQHQGVLHHFGRHARTRGKAEGREARAGLDQSASAWP